MLTRSLEKAKEAWKNKDIDASKAAHEGKVHKEIHMQAQGQYIKSIIYGGLDGTITTFAVVAGVAGAALSPGIVIILGMANLIADGISMAIGDYLSTKSEQEYNKEERKREAWEVENYPKGEKLELIEIYVEKGIEKADAEKIVDIISKYRKAWLDIMMVEELGIVEDNEPPLNNAIATFLSFAFFGFFPILSYVVLQILGVGQGNLSFILACILTFLTLFSLGALKTRITGKNWFLSGLEMAIVGGIAAAAAYGVGALLGGLGH